MAQIGNIPALEETNLRQLASRGDEETQRMIAEALPTQRLLITLMERTAYYETALNVLLGNADSIARHIGKQIGEEYDGIPQSIRESLFNGSRSADE